MRDILIVTPYYPYPKKKNLVKNTDVVYTLSANKSPDMRITVIYYYLRRKLDAVKSLKRLLGIKSYAECLYRDDRENDVLLFENPGFFPHRQETLSFFNRKYLKLLNAYLEDRRIDPDLLIVHFPVIYTGFADRIQAKKKIAIFHATDTANAKRIAKSVQFARHYQEAGFRSKQIENQLLPRLPSMPHFICMSGVPDGMINRAYSDRLWKKDGILQIVTVGKLIERKNIRGVLLALSKLPSSVRFRYTVIGDGEEKENLEKTARELGIADHVVFMGSLSREAVFQRLREMDLFVLVSWRETLGLAYLEALSSGDLVIASKGRGIDGMIEDGNGVFFVEPDDVQALCGVISKIDEMKIAAIQKMREANYQFVSQYTDSQMSRRYLDR